jgi:plasmid stabilization system protein ParE
MSYVVALANEAEEDLTRLVASLPLRRRQAAIAAVAACIEQIAKNPLSAPTTTHERPTWRVEFNVDGVRYAWGATYQYSEDEKAVVITHVFRLLM